MHWASSILLISFLNTGLETSCLIPCFPGVALLCIIPIPAGQKLLITSIVIAGKFFVTIAFAILFFYTNEIFPTVIRGTGVGTSEMICRDKTGGANFQICVKQ